MPKTEVILTHNIVGLGAESDHVKVSPGYARNYLFPQGFAIPLTAANKRRIEALRQRRAEREAHEFNTMSELSKSISKLTCTIKVKTGDDGKMFGSVTSGTIADELKHLFDITLDKKKIHLEHPIKTLGEHDVELRLHPEVTTTLKVHIESTTPLPQPVEAPEGKGREGREGREGRGPRDRAGRDEHRPRYGERKAEARPAAKGEAKPAAKTEAKHAPRAEAKPAKVEKPHAKSDKKPKSEKTAK
ncbi:MAG TPA: 50S ribosomal protein L9 [Candidatus Binatia bacterium]|nr:50S ribosomal protein L9 [Candidatus Binatia bacterium]